MTTTVDIVLSVYNAGPFLDEQIRSLQAQTHRDWRLWVRDDGSTDDSLARIRALAEGDGRIHLHPPDGVNLGATLCYSWLLERLPDDATRIFCCDADDVWAPEKIAVSLAAMDAAETEGPGPVLVHTDLEMVDETLRPIAPSYWRHVGIVPTEPGVRHLLVANVATGPTILMNRALLDRTVPIPEASPHHDWWIALVAGATGRIVGLPRSTVLYRRHGRNVTRPPTGPVRGAGDMISRFRHTFKRRDEVVRWIQVSARQAEAFLERFDGELPEEVKTAARRIASLPGRGALGRKSGVLRHHAASQKGLLRKLGLVLRA